MNSNFHHLLIQYLNTGVFSKKNFFSSILFSQLVLKKNAQRINQEAQKLRVKEVEVAEKVEVSVPVYQDKHPFVLKMMKQLELELKDDLMGAYLQGSLATNEQIRYSDFDALIILKDDVLKDAQRIYAVAKKLNHLQKIIQQFDPLQHHGWFILTEQMLLDYPITYYPPVLFEHSKSLLKGQGLSFNIQVPRETDYETPFMKLAYSLIHKLGQAQQTNNAFIVKSNLSEFMLLPSFYLQAKNGEGIYKKDSFELAAKDFKIKDWEIMNRVSAIRSRWDYVMNPIQRALLCSQKYSIRKVARKFAPTVVSNISEELNTAFYKKMLELTVLMKKERERSV